jgi:hypothetical protein
MRMTKRAKIALRKNHPLVGTWEEQDNPTYKTKVIYEITIDERGFAVTGLDEETGETLEISKVSWDGEVLRFSSCFPPTGWRARHVMRFVGKGRAVHDVRGVREHWIRRSKRR